MNEQTRTKIFLEIGNVSQAVSFQILSSSDPMSSFSVTLHRDQFDFKLVTNIWGGSLFWTSGIVFRNSVLEMDLRIPEKIILDPLQYLRLKSILSFDNYKVLRFVDVLTNKSRKVFIERFPPHLRLSSPRVIGRGQLLQPPQPSPTGHGLQAL